MAIDSRIELEKMNKSELIDAIMEYSADGAFPVELIFLRNTTVLNDIDLGKCWYRISEMARDKDKTDGYRAAEYLRDGAELCFEKAKLFSNEDDTFNFCNMLANDLRFASEQDGIGMKWDDEWMYIDVAEKIEEYLGREQINQCFNCISVNCAK